MECDHKKRLRVERIENILDVLLCVFIASIAHGILIFLLSRY